MRLALICTCLLLGGCANTITVATLPNGATVKVYQSKLWDDQHWIGSLNVDGSVSADISGTDTTNGGQTLMPVLMKSLEVTGKALDKLSAAKAVAPAP